MNRARWAGFSKKLALSQRYKVDGHSMFPALRHGQHVAAQRLAPDSQQVDRGNLVVFRHPIRRDSVHIKRVVGLPAERISLRDGLTFVNGLKLEEPYCSVSGMLTGRNLGEWLMDDDEYFLMGDNRSDSEDSRLYGPVGCHLIVGVVWLRYWPPSRWTRFR